MKRIILFFLLFFSFPFYTTAGIGDEAPDFKLAKLGGDSLRLSDYRGQIVYIYWFGWG